jgi:hypothetical protein
MILPNPLCPCKRGRAVNCRAFDGDNFNMSENTISIDSEG